MTLNDYQQAAMTTCMPSSENFSYMMLNLVGEVGEFASKVAKGIRKGQLRIGPINTFEVESKYIKANELVTDEYEPFGELEENLQKEAGDILWQLAGLCNVMGWTLEDIAQMNLDKLAARKQAGTIDGNGDGISGKERTR